MGVTFCLLLSPPGARSASRGSSGTGGAPVWIPARPFGPSGMTSKEGSGPSGMTSVKKGRAVIPAGRFDPGAVTWRRCRPCCIGGVRVSH